MNYIIILFKTNRNYPERVSSCPKLNKIREKNNLLFTLFLQLQLLLSLCCVETRYIRPWEAEGRRRWKGDSFTVF